MPVIMPKIRNMGAVGINIHYGAEAPADTSKLWVKTDTTPSSLTASPRDLEMTESDLMTCGATMPKKNNADMCAAAVGTNVYVFGGRASSSQSAGLNTILKYDAEADTLTTLSTVLPSVMFHGCAAAVGTKIYLFGGGTTGEYVRTNSILMYDTEADTITTLDGTLPEACMNLTACVVGTKIYLVGGRGAAFYKDIKSYDTDTGTITTMGATLAETGVYRPIALVGSKIYCFGARGGSTAYEKKVEVYDIDTDTVTALDNPMPIAFYHAAAVSVGTKVYLYAGGANGSRTRLVFDTETGTFTTQSGYLETAWKGIAAAKVTSGDMTKIFIFTGAYATFYAGYASDAIYASEFKTALATGTAYMKTAPSKNLFPFISGDTTLTVGVDRVYIGDAGETAAPQEAYLYDETTSEWKLIK